MGIWDIYGENLLLIMYKKGKYIIMWDLLLIIPLTWYPHY